MPTDRTRSESSRRTLPSILRSRATVGAAVLGLGVASLIGVMGSTTADAAHFSNTYNTDTDWTVPAGVTSVDITAVGGGGGDGADNGAPDNGDGGAGGVVQGTVAVTPGQVLHLRIGQAGQAGSGRHDDGAGASGGHGAGGNGGNGSLTGGHGGGGGSASRVDLDSTMILIAGGGGGGAGNGGFGNGGGGGAGDNHSGAPGDGAGHGNGGSGYRSGQANYWNGGDGSDAGSSSSAGGGGGGGAGFYGGWGGAGGGSGGGGGGGGAGGTNWIASDLVDTATSGNGGNPGAKGRITLSYGQITATLTTVSAVPSPSVVGQAVTVQAQVSVPGEATIPAGSMQLAVGGTPIGTAQSVDATGLATFTTTALPVGPGQLTATFTPTDGDDFGTSTGALDVTVARGATTTTVSDPVDTTAFGSVATFKALVAAVAPAAGTPTGSVQFAADGTAIGGPVAVTADGVASLSTSSLGVGPHQITAAYAGSGDFTASVSDPTTHTVQTAPSGVVVSTSKNPAVVGESLTFTATVSAAGSSVTPSGEVTIVADGVPLGTSTLGVGGVATLSGAGLGVGDHAVSAVYAGDGGFATSTSPSITQRVTKGAVTVAIVPPTAPSRAGDLVTLVASLGVVAPAVGTPTGTIQFFVGATALGPPVPVSGGAASISTNLLEVGASQITARYSGDDRFADAVSAPVVFSVDPVASSVVVSSSLQPSAAGAQVSFTAAVSGSGSAVPTGAVRFTIDGVEVDTVNLGATGHATFTTASLAVGTHTVVAEYVGDGRFTGSTSAPLDQEVTRGAVTVVVDPPSGSIPAGEVVPLRATVAPVAPATDPPTGQVQFLVDGAPLGDPVSLVAGVAVAQTGDLSVGSRSVTASYLGDATYSGSTSAAVAFPVTDRLVQLEVSPSITHGTVGDPVRAAARVSALIPGPAPTGSVQFLVNGDPVGDPITLGSDGTAGLALDALGVGVSTVSARYDGDAIYRSASADPVSVELAAPQHSTVTAPPTTSNGVVVVNNLGQADSATPSGWSSSGSSRSGNGSGTSGSSAGGTLATTGSRTGLLGGVGAVTLALGAALLLWRCRSETTV